MQNNFETPILLLVFNRPEVTRKVFQTIREIRPTKLFVAADGPRVGRPDDIPKCVEVREIVSVIDWPCELKTLFRTSNLGCKHAVSQGITWFFEHVTQGIILEDDCLPAQSFYYYCDELLNRYQHDTRITHINGNNFNSSEYLKTGYSYHFTYFPQVWGWATWKRAWNRYDPDIKLYDHFNDSSFFLHCGCSEADFVVLKKKWNNIKHNRIDTWDYQWHFINMLEGSVVISPTQNLISNIGFGNDATHTHNIKSERQNLKRQEFNQPLVHPPCLFIDEKLNSFYKRMMIRESRITKIYRKIVTSMVNP
jgi:hypothetical protein